MLGPTTAISRPNWNRPRPKQKPRLNLMTKARKKPQVCFLAAVFPPLYLNFFVIGTRLHRSLELSMAQCKCISLFQDVYMALILAFNWASAAWPNYFVTHTKL